MRKRIVIAVVLGLLAVAATAMASSFKVHKVVGNLVLDAEGGFKPNALPRNHDAPIVTHGGGKLSTVTGEIPPVLDTFVLEFDKHGHLDTTGLPHCTKGKLVATEVAKARRHCRGAIVGKGYGKAVVALPEQIPFTVGSPITLFNGPKKNGNVTILAHAYLDYPGPTTFIVPIVIEKIHKGVYGYRVKVKIPKIAGGYGHPLTGKATVGRKWRLKHREHSFINARCQTGHFLVRGEFTFKEDETILNASFFLPCKVRK
ncbi:MAG: hypothetical protein ACM3N0_13225 [Chloroflexota bacterium]